MVRARAAILTALALLDAGCSAQSTPAGPAAIPVGLVTHVLPGCTTAAQEGPVVSVAATSMAPVPMGPFGVVTTGDGRWAFASLTWPRTIGVMKVAASPVPSLIRQVPVAAAGLLGEALTPGDRYLLVANEGSGADVLSVQELEQGGKHPLVGTLAAPVGAQLPGSIEVAVSPDGDFGSSALKGAPR